MDWIKYIYGGFDILVGVFFEFFKSCDKECFLWNLIGFGWGKVVNV